MKNLIPCYTQKVRKQTPREQAGRLQKAPQGQSRPIPFISKLGERHWRPASGKRGVVASGPSTRPLCHWPCLTAPGRNVSAGANAQALPAPRLPSCPRCGSGLKAEDK